MIDGQNLDRAILPIQLQSKLLLKCQEEGRKLLDCGSVVGCRTDWGIVGRPIESEIEISHDTGLIDNGAARLMGHEIPREHFHRHALAVEVVAIAYKIRPSGGRFPQSFGPVLSYSQYPHRQLLRLPMKHQVKTVCQEALCA